MAVDVTNLMKKLYMNPMAEKKVVEKSALLEWIDRSKDFTSTRMDVALIGANNQRVGSDFEMTKSGSLAQESSFQTFSVPQKQLYGFTQLRGQDFSNFVNGGSESYFLDQQKGTIDQTLSTLGANAAEAAYGSGKIILGVVGAGTASPVTLATTSNAGLIYPGMALRFGPNADGSSLRTGTAVVTKVDVDNGLITYSGTITSLGVNDYVFPANDVSAGANIAQGLEYYNGLTANSNANGVDQTISTFQYSGMRFDCNASATRRGFTIVDGINRAIALHTNVAKGGPTIDVLFMNPIDIDRLQASRNGMYVPFKTSASEVYKDFNLSIEGFQFGSVGVVRDSFCPEGVARGLSKDAFRWMTCGTIGKLDTRDGLSWRLAAVGDNWEAQFAQYHNFVLRRPSGALRIKLPTVLNG